MNRKTAPMIVLVALAGLSLGCAAIQKDAGFKDVQAVIRERSGFVAHWDQQPKDEGPVAERIQALLSEDLTDRNAIEIALLSNRRFQATFEELGIARADLIQARAITNPLLEGEVRFPMRPFEIALTQSLLDLITLRRRRGLADASFEAAKIRVTDDVLDLIAELRSAFYAMQGAEQIRAMRQSIVESARVSAELAIRQREAGNTSDLELENEQAVLERAKLDLARSESEVLEERERLNALMGLWGQETDWALASKLPDLPPDDPDATGLESLAVSQRLDLAAARQDVEVAARALPLARSTVLGDVAVGVHTEREPDGLSTTGPAVHLPIPIFNRGKAARARAEALLRQAQQRHAALAVEVRAEVRATRNRVHAARSRAEYYRNVILPRRERIVAFSQQHYNFMLIGAFQLLLARQDETRARQEHIEALRDYWIARSDLERAVGGSLPRGAPGVPPAHSPERPESEETPRAVPHHDPGGMKP